MTVLSLPESTLRIGLQKAHMPIGHADKEEIKFLLAKISMKSYFLKCLDKYVENYREENEFCVSQAGE